MQAPLIEKKSLGLPTPAELANKQRAHIRAVIEPELTKLHDRFKLWTPGQLPPDPVGSALFYSSLGIDRLSYMLSLRNKEIILPYKDQYPDTIDAFIQEINQTEFWLATKTTYTPKAWIELYRTLKELATGNPTFAPFYVIRIIPDFKKKVRKDILSHFSGNFQQRIDEDVSKIATCLASKMVSFPAVSLSARFKANHNFTVNSEELQAFGIFPDSLTNFIQHLKSEDYWTATAVDQKGPLPGVASTLIGIELQVNSATSAVIILIFAK